MAAFDADQRGDFALLADAHNVIGGVGHLESIGIGCDHAPDDVDLFERQAHGGAFLAGLRRDVGRPELRADAALDADAECPCAAQRFLRLRRSILRKDRSPFLAELPGQIVVAVDQQCLAVDAQCFFRQLHRGAGFRVARGIFFFVLGESGTGQGEDQTQARAMPKMQFMRLAFRIKGSDQPSHPQMPNRPSSSARSPLVSLDGPK